MEKQSIRRLEFTNFIDLLNVRTYVATRVRRNLRRSKGNTYMILTIIKSYFIIVNIIFLFRPNNRLSLILNVVKINNRTNVSR